MQKDLEILKFEGICQFQKVWAKLINFVSTDNLLQMFLLIYEIKESRIFIKNLIADCVIFSIAAIFLFLKWRLGTKAILTFKNKIFLHFLIS